MAGVHTPGTAARTSVCVPPHARHVVARTHEANCLTWSARHSHMDRRTGAALSHTSRPFLTQVWHRHAVCADGEGFHTGLTFRRVCGGSLVSQSKVWVIAAGGPRCRHEVGQTCLGQRSNLHHTTGHVVAVSRQQPHGGDPCRDKGTGQACTSGHRCCQLRRWAAAVPDRRLVHPATQVYPVRDRRVAATHHTRAARKMCGGRAAAWWRITGQCACLT